MNKATINKIENLLKEKINISEEHFLHFEENAHHQILNSINLINNFQNEVINAVNSINEDMFQGDYFHSISEINTDDIIKIQNNLYELNNQAIEFFNNNFLEFSYLFEENNIIIPNDIKEEYQYTIELLNKKYLLEQQSEFIDIPDNFIEINEILVEADKSLSVLRKILDEEDNKQNEIKILEPEDYESEDNYNDALEEINIEIEGLHRDIKEEKSNLSSFWGDFQNNTNTILESLSNNFQSLMEEALFYYEDNVLNPLLGLIKSQCPKLLITQAQQYVNNMGVNGFLESKNNHKSNNNNILEKIQLTKQQHIEEFIIFNDDSILCKSKGNFQEINQSKHHYYSEVNFFMQEYIKFKYRKTPKYIIPISKMFHLSNNNVEQFFDTINMFDKLKQVIENNKEDIYKLFNSKAEFVFDKLQKIEKKHIVQQTANRMLSKKYIHLLTDESLLLIEKLIDEKIPYSAIQDNVGKKIAAFNEPKDFSSALQSYINSINEFDFESKINKVNNFNAEIISTKNNTLIIKIDNFLQSSELGSYSWCISRSKSMFDSYSLINNQYFIYDFNQDSSSPYSMIGITIKKDGSHRASHLKNDNAISEGDIFDLKKHILINDSKNYQFSQNIINKFSLESNSKKTIRPKLNRQ